MTEPLPTLAQIDETLIRSIVAEDMARAEIESLTEDIAELREQRDALLEQRTLLAMLDARAV